jgi:hypothetical protein
MRRTPGRTWPRVFPFEQTRLSNARQIPCLIRQCRVMTVPNNHKDYARYAEHCLKIVTAITDQESRRIQREMAAEWLRLADAIRHPPGLKQMQMQMQME